MIFRKKLLPSIALATSMGLGMAASPTIHAETASATLDVTAGLRTSMSLSCPIALSFGWTTLDLATATAVILTVATDGSLSIPSATGVTLGTTASAGECTVTGVDPTQSNVNITIAGTTTLVGGEFDGVPAPTTGLEMAITTVLADTSVAVNNGSATFNIGGTMTLPAAVTPAHMGGYTAERTITVTDAI